MRRSLPIRVPAPMTVRHAYGDAPLYILTEETQPGLTAPVVDVTPRAIEPGFWVLQWQADAVTVEPATGDEVDRWLWAHSGHHRPGFGDAPGWNRTIARVVTPEQVKTCAWMAHTNFDHFAIRKDLLMVVLGDGRFFLVYPDGSYQQAKLGNVHEPPNVEFDA